MADSQATFHPSHCFLLLCLLSMYLSNSTVDAGCIRTRCSGTIALRRELQKKVQFLYVSSRHLAGLTYRAENYTNFEYSITDSCNPTCDSPATAIMQDMNLTRLTRSSWMNLSRSTVLEFYRRVSLDFSQQLTNSLADLSRAQNVTTPATYLKKLQDMVDTMKRLVTKAVTIDRKLLGLTPLSTTAGQQSSSTVMRNATGTSSRRTQSLSTVACHLSRCVLYNLRVECYRRMIGDFLRIRNIL